MDKVPTAGCGGRHIRKTSVFLGCLKWKKVMDDFFHGQRAACRRSSIRRKADDGVRFLSGAEHEGATAGEIGGGEAVADV